MFYNRKYTRGEVRRQVIGAIVGVCLALVLSFWFNTRRDQMMTNHPSGPFISIPAPVGIDPKTVVIYAPLHCPSFAAKYADEIAKELSKKNIPNSRINNLEFRFTTSELPLKDKIDALLNGDAPIVIVKGKAKGNPAINEVIDEYNRQ